MAARSKHGKPETGERVSAIAAWLRSFWQFARPHTIVGTTLSVLALAAIALSQPDVGAGVWTGQPATLAAWLGAIALVLLACLAGNVYIVGLNQLTDIAIDRINKPKLPLASGAFSVGMGRAIVAVAGMGAIALALLGSGRAGSPYLAATVGLSVAIGTAYSLPPLRLKRFPWLASACILVVRGLAVNLGVFAHLQAVLGQAIAIPPSVWGLTVFVLLFSFAIAILKDVPDTEGDARFGIATLSLRWGQDTVLRLGQSFLATLYLAFAGAAIGGGIGGASVPVLAVSHGGLAALVWWRGQQVEAGDREAVAQFYQFVWKLFYLEYLLFPLACWWGRG